MDENVLFNPGDPNSQKQPENTPEQPVSPPTAVSNVSSVGQPNDVSATAQSTELPVTDGQIGEPSPPGNPPPIHHGIFGGILMKIIIGVVILIVIIFAVILFMPKGASNTKAKLVWWGLWEDQSVMQPLIDDFHKTHPNITITYVKQDPKQYRQKLETRIKNGTGPDIFRFHNTWVPMLSGVLLPLSSDVITPTDFKKSFYPVMQTDLTQNGAIYGIPLGTDTLGLFVNTEILKQAGIQPPQTWEDFVSAAKALTVKDTETKKIKTAGAALGTYGNITHAPDILSLLFIQQGVDMNKFPKDSNNEKDALDFYTSFAKTESSVWDSTLDESILAFSRGTLAMYIGYSWDIFKIQAINKNLPFQTYPVPQLVGRKATVASYWVEGVSAKSPNQKAALLFMQYLAKKDTAQKFYSLAAKERTFGEPYARTDLASSLKENKILYPFVSQLDYAYSSYMASDTNDGEGGINFLSNNYLGNAVNAVVNDNSSTDTVIQTLGQGIGQVLQKYGVR